MKTQLVEVHVNGDKETIKTIDFKTKYEAERFADIYNENRSYHYIDKNGKEQSLFFYVTVRRR